MRPKDMRPKDMRRKDMRRKVLRLYANSYIYVETRYFASPDLRVSGPHHLFKKKHFVSPVQDYLKYT